MTYITLGDLDIMHTYLWTCVNPDVIAIAVGPVIRRS
jgi:hypothetical protein